MAGMFYANIKDYAPGKFKRLTGVTPETFAVMVDALRDGMRVFGRPPNLCLQDRLLMALMYFREYRTYGHIGETYGVSESTVCRTVKRVENVLIGDERFHLPGKKVLCQSDTIFEVTMLDATECPCERPKKNRDVITAGRRSVTLRKGR
jgi:hypothetical protein